MRVTKRYACSYSSLSLFFLPKIFIRFKHSSEPSFTSIFLFSLKDVQNKEIHFPFLLLILVLLAEDFHQILTHVVFFSFLEAVFHLYFSLLFKDALTPTPPYPCSSCRGFSSDSYSCSIFSPRSRRCAHSPRGSRGRVYRRPLHRRRRRRWR